MYDTHRHESFIQAFGLRLRLNKKSHSQHILNLDMPWSCILHHKQTECFSTTTTTIQKKNVLLFMSDRFALWYTSSSCPWVLFVDVWWLSWLSVKWKLTHESCLRVSIMTMTVESFNRWTKDDRYDVLCLVFALHYEIRSASALQYLVCVVCDYNYI